MKKSMIILVVSLCFLVACMFYVVHDNKKEKVAESMDIDYINENYEIDLYEELKEDKLDFYVSGKYVGDDEIVDKPDITLSVNCLYVYTDADETFTDMLTKDVALNSTGNLLSGETSIELKRDVLDDYNCSYKVEKVNGKYLEK